MKRDKVNLDIFWLKDESLDESSNLPAPEVIAADIAADLEVALEQFAMIAEDLKREASTNTRSPLSLSNITLDHSRYNTH